MNGYDEFYDNRRCEKGCFVPFLIICIIIVLTTLCCVGCKTIEYVEVPKVEKEYISIIDSIYFLEKDSIYIRDKGDTVFVAKWHTRYKEVIRTDTILKSDSIRVPYPVNHYFKPTWWEQTKMKGFYVFGGFILIWIVAWVIRKKLGLV